MASKKRRAKSAAGSGGAGAQPPGQPQSQASTVRASAMLGTLRLVALMSATIVALLVFEALQNLINFWLALGVAFVAGGVARAAFVWLERVWLRAAARRALAREARRADEPETQEKARSK